MEVLQVGEYGATGMVPFRILFSFEKRNRKRIKFQSAMVSWKYILPGNSKQRANTCRGSFDRINSAEINIHRRTRMELPMEALTCTGANDYVGSIVTQPDGKILISGEFTSFNGVAESQVARLNVNEHPNKFSCE
jgi:hypothetical protein